MKKYFCDVCGAELPEGQQAGRLDLPVMKLCPLEDLCVRCEKLIRGLDVPALVQAELRDMMARQKVPLSTWRTVGKALKEGTK